MSLGHIIDEGDRWRIIHEVSRRRRVFVALIPKDATHDEMEAFTDTVSRLARRRIAEERAKHGEAQGQGEGEVPRADAAGAPEKKEDPQGGGPQGGPDPQT